MAVDEALIKRFREGLLSQSGVHEQRMMGGTCFMVNGHMLGGAHRDKDGTRCFVFRVGRQNEAAAERIGGGTTFRLGDRVMRGFFLVEADACSDACFEEWKALALAHALSLPAR